MFRGLSMLSCIWRNSRAFTLSLHHATMMMMTQAAKKLWPDVFDTPAAAAREAELVEKMRIVRPVVETGWVCGHGPSSQSGAGTPNSKQSRESPRKSQDAPISVSDCSVVCTL